MTETLNIFIIYPVILSQRMTAGLKDMIHQLTPGANLLLCLLVAIIVLHVRLSMLYGHLHIMTVINC